MKEDNGVIHKDITATTKILCVIGDPIEHSKSPAIHNAAIRKLNLDYVYLAFRVRKDMLQKACEGMRALGILGMNVTIPHKIEIRKYMDKVEGLANLIGSVNTVKNIDGMLIGRNTDAEGALASLEANGYDPSNKRCLLFGAGGAAKAIAFILGTKGVELHIINRTYSKAVSLKDELENNFSDIERLRNFDIEIKKKPVFKVHKLKELPRVLKDTDLLINATSVGMYPDINKSPLDLVDGALGSLKSETFVYDIVYNPEETKLLKQAKEKGCRVLGGLEMLVRQGALAFKWWTDIDEDIGLMKEVLKRELNLGHE
ncbi:MAG: shikimate dehydrogenase [Promethearchaeota archaeon]